jgi:iron uptake system component EfeO
MLPLVASIVLLTLAVGGCGSGEDAPATTVENSPQVEKAIARYRAYLDKNTAELVAAIKPLMAAIEAGDVSTAESRYAFARVPFGQIEPSFAILGDYEKINGLAAEVRPSEFGGFHRIEKALWEEGATEGMTPVARQLLADVEALHRRVETAELELPQIAVGMAGEMNGILTTKVTGEEERYSHIDLVDIAAGTEGAEAAFDAIKPALDESDPTTKEIEAQFEKVYDELHYYGTPAREPEQRLPGAPGVIFVVFSELSDPAVEKIKEPIHTLAEQLSELPEEVE